ncbi:hypothetical protein S40288_01385 [Stachybotrys chartarum IBT 40288]|nr:hypothetical protein S40288_01385 [Stachybotrys chartarum IBT 40288]
MASSFVATQRHTRDMPSGFDSNMHPFDERPTGYFNVAQPIMSSPPPPLQSYASYSSYPMYAGLQSTNTQRPISVGSHPIVLNRPRKLSSTSVATVSTVSSQQSVFSPMQPPSAGSITSVESLGFAPWPRPEMLRRSAMTSTIPRKASKPDEMFGRLPGEVLELILDKLKGSHLDKGNDSCATCWMRDLCNVSLASRKWSRYSQAALYTDIQLIGQDSATHRKKLKMVQGCRMLILRRTLRARPHLAALVRSLKVPTYEGLINGSNPKGSSSPDQYEDLVATLVMACPNLETLAGPLPSYCHSFKKIIHALSTRRHFREMNWVIKPLASDQERRVQAVSQERARLSTPSQLDHVDQAAFFDFHADWSSLTTLSIFCQPGATLAPDQLLKHTILSLPSLQHLHLCNLPRNAFNDNNLVSLPPLQSLSLSHIDGITSNGLSAFATLANSAPLRKLQLRHTPLTSLPALARILSNLGSLEVFSLVQVLPPTMPEADSFTLWMMPYLASASISKLHWDITNHLPDGNPADDILARSIAAGGFPSLRTLRTPNDPEGVFQDLCRPAFRLDLAPDRFRKHSISSSNASSASGSKSPSKHMLKRSSFSLPACANQPQLISPCTDLSSARLAAQARIEKSRQTPRFSINVTEDGALVESFQVAGFIGTVGSPIEYYLRPDDGSSDEKGGLVDVRDLAPDDSAVQVGGRAGCQGRWNMKEGVMADKRENDSWWHTERPRWSKVTV